MKLLKDKVNAILMRALVLIVVTVLPHIAMADDDPGPCPDCPIDGGLVIFLAAGVGYGIKKYRNTNKNTEEGSKDTIIY